MKRALRMTCIAVGGLLSFAAARADDWGCTVLLCLSNPGGPKAVAECVPPIDRLWEHLRNGGSFPTCQMSEGSGSASAGTYVRHRYTHYDPCPGGTIELAAGLRAASAHEGQTRPGRLRRDSVRVATYATGIGSGDGLWPQAFAKMGMVGLPPKVCVGTRTGVAYGEAPDGEAAVQLVPVGLYDRVLLLNPNISPRVIDVYVDNALTQRVRW